MFSPRAWHLAAILFYGHQQGTYLAFTSASQEHDFISLMQNFYAVKCQLFNTLNYFAVILRMLMLLLPRLSQVNCNRSVDIHSTHLFY